MAARAMTLSADEETLVEVNPAMIEREEGWLYFALSIARDCRMAMERLERGSIDWLLKQMEREGALVTARAHAQTLVAHVGLIEDDLIAGMMRAEGI